MRTGDPASSKVPPEVLLKTEDVGAWYIPGDGPDLVVTFGGVGLNPKTAPPVEFVGTAHQGGKNHVLALNDMKRTWYSQPAVLTQIRDVFSRMLERVSPRKVHALGNSMGAYGAILFASEMGLASSIAFSPQYSMKPDIVRETRWAIYRPAFGDALAESIATPLAQAPGDTWILHGAMGIDLRHYTQFAITDRVHHAVFPGANHDLASVLKARSILVPFVDSVFSGDQTRAEETLAQLQPIWRRQGSQDEMDAITAARAAFNAKRAALRAARKQRKNRV
jgi:hypothetical protein